MDRLSQPTNRSIYLSIFRVYVAFHILKRVFLQWNITDILYKKALVATSSTTYFGYLNLDFFRNNLGITIYIFMMLAVLYAFGIGKQITGLLLFIGLEIFQRMNEYILNGGDNLMVFLLMYTMLADSYNYFSFKPLRYKSETVQKIVNTITNLGVICIMMHLCMVYFLSGFHKIHADVWFNGVATYYTFASDRFAGTKYNKYLVQNGVFVTLTTYFTIFWEISFCFLIWMKKWRIPMLIMGILLHIGIYIFMMIHDFEILYIMVYGFFFTDDELRHYYSKVKNIFSRRKKLTTTNS